MNIPLIIAFLLTLSAFFLHTFIGDKELKLIEPEGDDPKFKKQETWTMTRAGWHWVSFDLLFAAVGLGVINFSDFIENERQLLLILSFYLFGYGIVWLISIFISKSFPKNYLKLGQWMLLWVISGLVYFGI